MLYILDTCAYLRLAKSINPLLGKTRLAAPDGMQVLSEVHTEWAKAQHLQTKFPWVSDPEHVADRAPNLVEPPTDLNLLHRTCNNIAATASMEASAIKRRGCSVPSRTDCLLLAYVFCLSRQGVECTAVTDDGGLMLLAKILKVKAERSISIVERMHVAGHLLAPQIQAMASYLDYISDLPADWRSRAPSLFGITL